MREKGKQIERKPTAIIYIRMSTQYQVQADSNSAEMQRTACMKICQDNNLHVAKVIEQVKSGKLYRKDLFNVIKNEMRAGDCIVVYSITRFARNQTHAHGLIDLLKKKKCRLLSASENMDTAKDDTLLGLFVWLAEIESRQISSRVKSSIQAKKERAEHVGGMPYGYKYSDGKGSPLEINEDEMILVQRMKKMRNEDKMSFLKIARTLNVEGVLSPKKQILGGWTEMTVKRIVERDESKVLMKGKRSWYIAKEQANAAASMASSSTTVFENHDDSEDEDEDDEDEENEDNENEENENEERNLESQPELLIESKQKTISSNDLQNKPIAILRAIVTSKKKLFGLDDESIANFSKENLIDLLTMSS